MAIQNDPSLLSINFFKRRTIAGDKLMNLGLSSLEKCLIIMFLIILYRLRLLIFLLNKIIFQKLILLKLILKDHNIEF